MLFIEAIPVPTERFATEHKMFSASIRIFEQICHPPWWLSWLERLTVTSRRHQKVDGSSPSRGVIFCKFHVQLFFTRAGGLLKGGGTL